MRDSGHAVPNRWCRPDSGSPNRSPGSRSSGHLRRLRRSRQRSAMACPARRDAPRRRVGLRRRAYRMSLGMPIGVRPKQGRTFRVSDQPTERLRQPLDVAARNQNAVGFHRAGSLMGLRCRSRRSASPAPSPRSGRYRTARDVKADRTHRYRQRTSACRPPSRERPDAPARPCRGREFAQAPRVPGRRRQGRHETATPCDRSRPSAAMKMSKPFLATKRPIAPMTGGCRQMRDGGVGGHIDHAGM